MNEGSAWLYRATRLVAHILLVAHGARRAGDEHVPLEGPCIIVCNHVSYIDPAVVGWAVRRRLVHFMAKREAFRHPAGRWFMRGLGSFPVDRGRPDRRALEHSLELLRRGRVVGLFPEGTRSLDCTLRPFHVGASLLAEHSRAPVIPAAVVNTRLFLEDRKTVRIPSICVRLGAPEQFGDEPGRAALASFAKRLESRVAGLVSECRKDSSGVSG